MANHPVITASELKRDLVPAQAALDEVKRTLHVAPGEDLSRYSGRRAPRRARSAAGRADGPAFPRLRLGAVLFAAALVGLGAVGVQDLRRRSEEDALRLAQAQAVMSSPTCERIFRSKGVISRQTDICLAAAHVVEGR